MKSYKTIFFKNDYDMGVNEYIKQLKEFQNYMCITLLLIENFWMKPNENKQSLQQNIDLGTFYTFTSTQSFSSTQTRRLSRSHA